MTSEAAVSSFFMRLLTAFKTVSGKSLTLNQYLIFDDLHREDMARAVDFPLLKDFGLRTAVKTKTDPDDKVLCYEYFRVLDLH